MMRRVIWVWVLVLVGFCFSVFGAEGDFRGGSWGMNMKDVRKVEKLRVEKKDKESLLYSTSVAEMDCKLLYMFQEDALIAGSYIFTQFRSNPSEYIDDYARLKDMMVTKYGKPDQDEMKWKDNTFRDDPNRWGSALLFGRLEFVTTWVRGDTVIVLSLGGESLGTKLVLSYCWKTKVEEKRAKEREEGLGSL